MTRCGAWRRTARRSWPGLPFDAAYAGCGGATDCAIDCATDCAIDFAAAARPPQGWGVLLVRKGGFAVARMAGERVVAHKIGQRHVQGRTKAGGQSQQRFARRRDNQARLAYQAATDHATRLLADGGRLPVVVGGDREAVEQVLGDRGLADLTRVGPWLAVPDPKRAILDQAVRDAQSLVVAVENA